MKLCNAYDDVTLANCALNKARVTMADLTMDMIMRSECGHSIPGDIAARIYILEDYLCALSDLLDISERSLIELLKGGNEDESSEALGGAKRGAPR